MTSHSSKYSIGPAIGASLEQAGCWFLRSGIQESNGGVARFHRTDQNRNAAVSTEITGYAVSALCYLYSRTGNPDFLDSARRAALYLANDAWSAHSNTFPFEPGSAHAYFFDIGIIVRGLLSAWRATGDEIFFDRAKDAALSLAFDFFGEGVFHPVISLPEKQALDYEPRWSRSPGCYQLKSALAWLEIDDPQARRLFVLLLDSALGTHESFLSEESDQEKLMDRLHAYCYFLEALLYAPENSRARGALTSGIHRVATLLREIAPRFERSDVCAQLLRVRLIAHHMSLAPLDVESAREEADRTAFYQANDGGFWFGKKRGEILPFMNPVSTAFSMQALALYDDHINGRWNFELSQLI